MIFLEGCEMGRPEWVFSLSDYLNKDPYHKKLLRLLNKFYNKDPIDLSLLERAVFKDPNVEEDFFIAFFSDGLLLGFGSIILMRKDPSDPPERFRETLFIKIFAVDPLLEGSLFKDVFKKIIGYAEEKALEKGVKRIMIGGYPIWYIYPGVEIDYYEYIDLLEKMGYKKYREYVNYEIDLADFYVPQRILDVEDRLYSQNITIREVYREEIERVSNWVGKIFGAVWGREVALAKENDDPSIVIAEDEKGDILGFSAYSLLNDRRFGPIGVEERSRRLGIGSVLLYRSLYEMKIRGVRIAEIPWTDHLFFYSHLPGIQRIRHFILLEKILRS
jgi:GNAT superfamily N-acetyltransferase